MQVDLDRTQPFPNKKRKKHKKPKKNKIKNSWAPGISTKKQNRVKAQKAKNYKNAKNVKT